MFFTLKDATTVLMGEGFLYKGKTVKLRTVKTMAENGFFKSLKFCDCGQSFVVNIDEVEKIAKQGS